MAMTLFSVVIWATRSEVGPGNDVLVGELGRDNIFGDEDDDTIVTHLNNDLRASHGLSPFAELTADERQSRLNQLVADLPALQALHQALLSIPEEDRTPQEIAQLATIEDAITINLLSQLDLFQYQSIYVDTAQGGSGDDILFGSPNFDILLGGAGDDDLHSSRGYVEETGQGDIIKGEGGSNTLWFDGTDNDDVITVSAQLDGTTGNQQVVVDLDGDGEPDGFIEELTIQNVGIRALAGDDTVSVDFGNLALAGVNIDGGRGDDIVTASLLQSKATLRGGGG